MGGDAANDGGDHMKDAGIGLPATGAHVVTFPSFTLENGETLRDVRVAYSSYGRLAPSGNNGVVVGHSLTSNSVVHEWWGEMLGDGDQFAIDTSKDFVVCVNYLGSPYGTTSPVSKDPRKSNGGWYGPDFPSPCTIRDNVRLQRMLLDHLGVKHLKMAIGGSMGCMLALEWGATYPTYVDSLCLIAGCGRHPDWAIGIGEVERFAVMAGEGWNGGDYDASDPPKGGLAAARMTAMLTYRAPKSIDDKFNRNLSKTGAGVRPLVDDEIAIETHKNPSAVKSLPFYDVENYLRYQGRKFTRRFDPNCYVQLTLTLDTHDVSRGRGESYHSVLASLRHKTMVVGITSDALYPYNQQEELVRHMPNAEMYTIDSKHGHDAFLLEIDGLNSAIANWRRRERGAEGADTAVNIKNELGSPETWDFDEVCPPVTAPYGVVDARFVAHVEALIGDEKSPDGEVRVLRGAKQVAPYAGDMGHHAHHPPDLVVLPLDTRETASIVRLCYLRRVPVVTRGAGTGLEGGCVAYQGGVVIDTCLMKTMSMVHGEQLAVVGAGVLKNELNKFLEPKGLLFGPDPSSNPSIGGMASTGGSGMSTLKYGTSKENVRSMVVVTPTGAVIRTRQPVRKSSTGYELNALYLGAEGTLGVITELTVRTFPKPKVRCGAVVVFPDVKTAACTVVDAVRSNLDTLLRCELMNDEGIRVTNTVFKTTLDVAPTLFLEFVGNLREGAEGDWRAMLEMAKRNGAKTWRFAASGEELDELWDARRGCYLGAMRYRGLMAGDPRRKEKVYVGDVCVPTSRLAECVAKTEADFVAAGFPCVMCAHISDGNFHCLIPYAPDEEERLMALNDTVIERAISMGGAASGEHGVGIGKIKHVCWEHGAYHVDCQRRMKRALDPRMIMNPGKIFMAEKSEEGRRAGGLGHTPVSKL